jgi:two-component system response regulator YesN
MLKILLVEDELIEREAVNVILSRLSGYKIVGEAADGEEALSKARQLQPDIILMDIRIGKMDGLEVSQIIKTELPNTEIIIISAHDRFDYSRQALRAGAFDFLVKPVEPDTLLETLQQVRRRIEEARSQSVVQQSFKEQVSGFLAPFLLNEATSPAETIQRLGELKNVLFMLGLKDDESYAALVIKFAAEDCAAAAKKLLDDFAVAGYKFLITPIFDKKILVIVSDDRDSLTETALHRALQELLAYYERNDLAKRFLIGVGKIYARVNRLGQSVKEAMAALQVAEIIDARGPLFYDEINMQTYKENLAEVYQALQRVSQLVKRGEYRPAIKLLKTLSQKNIAFQEHNSANELIRLLAYEIMLFALQSVQSEWGSERNSELLKANWHSQWKQCNSLLDLMHWLVSMLKQIHEIHYRHEEIGDDRVIQAIEYMEENYKRELNLTSVANVISISPQYLSRLFKTKATITFADYLNKIRIEVAQKLLKESAAYPIKRIAVDVGYSSDIYFAFVFKKLTGLTPTEYREQNRRPKGS